MISDSIHWQCPGCLVRGPATVSCRCGEHEGRMLRAHETCGDAGCSRCGWSGDYPSLPPGTPAALRERAQRMLDMGALPAEALYLVHAGLDPDDKMARFALPKAASDAGPTRVDLTCLLLVRGRTWPGDPRDDVLDVVAELCDALDQADPTPRG